MTRAGRRSRDCRPTCCERNCGCRRPPSSGRTRFPPARDVGKRRYSERVLKATNECLVLDERQRVQDCGELLRLLGWGQLEDRRNSSHGEEASSAKSPARPPVSPTTRARAPQLPGGWSRTKDLANQAGLAAFLLALAGGRFWCKFENHLADETWTNSLGMEFALVLAGEFEMGSENQRWAVDERPLARVWISKGFQLGKHEVTHGPWVAVMESNPSYFKTCGSGCRVESVSWEQVQEFIGRLNGWSGTEDTPTGCRARQSGSARSEGKLERIPTRGIYSSSVADMCRSWTRSRGSEVTAE